jgi:hypothetical protein
MNKISSFWALLLVVTLLSGCIFSQNQPTPASTPESPKAEIVFQVNLPPSVDGNTPQYMLEVLDEVTGLPFNPVRYPLSPIDANHYFGRIPFNIGSIIKYRYIRMDGIPKVEFNAKNEPVRYRLHQVTGPAILEDTIAGWEGSPYPGLTGNLIGTVTNQDNIPIPNAMVVAGGERTFTNSEGQFDLIGLPVGMQNLAVQSLDGSQAYFEQGAKIAENAVTPARVYVSNQENVNVTFEVTPTTGIGIGNPLRLIGELYQLGNTYADLEGGMSTIASRAPLMQYDEGQKIYRATIPLPAGSYFRYKYSLGDGFWNAETNENEFVLRELTVPGKDITIRDSVDIFASPGTAPVEFQVTAPPGTPPGDVLSIQFNPFSWMGSIPMWSQGSNLWKFSLSSPLNMVPQTSFRICRNDQCGVTDADMSGLTSIFSPSAAVQTLEVNPTSWLWMNDQRAQPIIPTQVPAKGADFINGVEIDRNYGPRLQPYFDFGYQNIQELGANWVFITPTWSFNESSPSSIEIIPGRNPMWNDSSQQIQEAKSHNFKTAVFPSLTSSNPEFVTVNSQRSQVQWEEWFTQYRSFLLFYADLASVNQADALFLGGPGASIALPDQIAITDLNPEEAANFSTNHWQSLITDVRSHYMGKIFWAQRNPIRNSSLPVFITQLDGVYLLWNGISEFSPTESQESLVSQITEQFSGSDIQSLISLGKPVIVGLWIESTSGETVVCPVSNSDCFDEQSKRTNPQNNQLDLQQQVNLYAAAYNYFSNQAWVNGIVSRGYYPAAELLDPSASIHGKPSSQTIKAWFSGLTITPNQ